MRCREQPLIQQTRRAQACAQFAAHARCRQAIRRLLNQSRLADNVTARRCQAAADVFNQTARRQIRADFDGFTRLDEFAVTVVDQCRTIRVD